MDVPQPHCQNTKNLASHPLRKTGLGIILTNIRIADHDYPQNPAWSFTRLPGQNPIYSTITYIETESPFDP